MNSAISSKRAPIKNALKRKRTALYMECVDCEAAAVPVTNHRLKKIRIRVSRLFKDAGSKDREQGFTLVELLVVLAILGLLIALVAPAMIRQLGSAKHKIAEQSVERLDGILDLYRLDVGDYPSTAQGLAALNENSTNVAGWNGPYLKDAGGIKDPWGRAFQYRYPSQRPNHSFDIVSLGADGKPGGDGESADIINR
jgi:general secretion pathway protein G